MIQDSDDQVRALELADWLGVSERAVADYAHRGIIKRSGVACFRSRNPLGPFAIIFGKRLLPVVVAPQP